MTAGERIARGSGFGIAGGFDLSRTNPRTVRADRQLDNAVYHFADPSCGDKAVAPLFVDAPKNDVREKRQDVNGKL